MLNFACDYLDAAHPKVFEALMKNNFVKTGCYDESESDCFCNAAREKIRAACGVPDAEVRFLSGGTQTNKVVISTMLKPWQGVIAARTGHIAVHEAGAIEASGHKVIEIAEQQGKISAEAVDKVFRAWHGDGNRLHMVEPGMVYITQPTEYGTVYSLAELTALSEVCRRWGAPLYVDGARLFYALGSVSNNVTLRDLARLADVFYIGGTKCGLLFGEAVVFPKAGPVPGFFTLMKLGLELGRHAVLQADRIREALTKKGYELLFGSTTNQIFLRLTNAEADRLGQSVAMSFWERLDDEHVVKRIATSWATDPKDVDGLIALF